MPSKITHGAPPRIFCDDCVLWCSQLYTRIINCVLTAREDAVKANFLSLFRLCQMERIRQRERNPVTKGSAILCNSLQFNCKDAGIVSIFNRNRTNLGDE